VVDLRSVNQISKLFRIEKVVLYDLNSFCNTANLAVKTSYFLGVSSLF